MRTVEYCPICDSENIREDIDFNTMMCCENCGADFTNEGEVTFNPKDNELKIIFNAEMWEAYLISSNDLIYSDTSIDNIYNWCEDNNYFISFIDYSNLN